jgi:pterin-4a-carbinolamine dehydratase
MSEKKNGSKPVLDLKAERVQTELAGPGAVPPRKVQERLKAERVQERLKQMPGWALALEGKALDRAREFHHVEDAVDYAALALRMASRERYPVRVHVAGKSVVLTVQENPRPGVRTVVTDKLLSFAASLG